MIGRNQPAPVLLFDRLVNAPQLRVHSLAGLDCRLQFARVPNHVRIGKVRNHQVERCIVHGLHNRVSDRFRLHLWSQVVRGHLQRRNQRPVLAGEGNLDSPVEEVRHVRKLFRLRHAQIPQVVLRQHIGQDVIQRLRRHDERQVIELVVLRHTQVVKVLGDFRAGNRFIERFPPIQIAAALLVQAALASQHAGNLAGTVRSEVEVDANVFVANLRHRLARAINHHKGDNEFVGHAVVVTLIHARHGVWICAALGLAGDHRVKSLALAFPALVAVHGKVAAVHAGHFSHAILAHLLLKLRNIFRARAGRSVAPVHEAMHKNTLKPILARCAKQGVEVLQVRVHTAVGAQAEQVQLASTLARPLHRLHDGWILLEFA